MRLENLEDIYELSPMQHGMLFHSLYAPASRMYFEQVNSIIHGEMNASALEAAWQRVFDRHPALRTCFNWEDLDKPVQLVLKGARVALNQQDWSLLSEDQKRSRLEAFIEADKEQGFDLAQYPLMRLTLIRLSEDIHQFIWSHHHAIYDGWSKTLLIEEASSFYRSICEGADLHLKPARPYRDYIAWLRKQDAPAAQAFWEQTLKGFGSPTSLGIDRGNWNLPDSDQVSKVQQARLSPEAAEKLKVFAREHKLTLNTIVQGAWGLILSRYSGEQDVVFGATVSGRPAELEGVEAMVGLFINTLPVRVKVEAEQSVVEWLSGIQREQAEMRQYEYSSLVQVQKWSGVPGGSPLFENILVFENAPGVTSGSQGSAHRLEEVGSFERANYPLIVRAGAGQSIWLRIDFDNRRFEAAAISRMLKQLQTVLNGMAASPERRISELDLLTEPERKQLLIEYNDTRRPLPSGSLVHELFEHHASMTPERVAVEFESQQLSYRELNRRANLLAHYLQNQGVGIEDVVGVCLNRSTEAIVALLGILKAGGAYLPLDANYPAAQITHLLEDSGARIVITEQALEGYLSAFGSELVLLDAQWELISRLSEENLHVKLSAENLAYVIYTSGSTGKPKGVSVPHRAVARLVINSNFAEITPDDVFLQFAPLSFDASTFEVWGPLLNGAKLAVMPPHLASLEEMGEAIARYKVTILWLTSGLFHQMAEEQLERLKTVKQILTGGDVLSAPVVKKLLQEACACQVVNAYGPTENTTFTCYHRMKSGDALGASVPIGKPVTNTQAYLLDQDLRPVPLGVIGELLAGGEGLARCYLNQPGLTAEKFIPDPYSNLAGARLYRTGDLAKRLDDGNIEFIGRKDNQVKIRGFRIELEEIEAALAECGGVQASVVIARQEPGAKQLVAYVVHSQGVAQTPSELRGLLAQKLPEYMLPSAFVSISSLPLTPQGKVDRKALPALDKIRPEIEGDYVFARDLLEFQLAQIWEEVLEVRPVGVTDNFFELGGNSFSAMRLISHIRNKLGEGLPVAALFQEGTVERLAIILRKKSVIKPSSSLIPIQPRGAKRPFFCVHPFGGGVICYSRLALCLGEDQPFYGLQAAGLEGEREPISDLAELAAYHIEAMRSIEPKGPYLLGGWSFGGLVAFEMAQQLQRQDEKVALLALFDCDPLFTRDVVPDDTTEAGDQAIFLMGLFGEVLPIKLDRLGELSSEEQMLYMIDLAKKAKQIPPDFGLLEARRWLKLLVAQREAGLNYAPRAYSGSATLFSAAEGRLAEDADPTDGWGQLVTGKLEVRTVPGNHRSMMSDLNVEGVAAALKCCIEEVEQEHTMLISGYEVATAP